MSGVRFWATALAGPPLALGTVVGAAIGLTQLTTLGLTGSDAMALTSLALGVVLGAICAGVNREAEYSAAATVASMSFLLWLSIRAFWLQLPLDLAAFTVALMLPAGLIGAHAVCALRGHQA